jgi:hypothetical protein
MHSKTEAMTYAAACTGWPALSRFSVSRLNDEKVVNPPQKPTIRNCRHAALSMFEARIPIAKHPITLMDSVPHGKAMPSQCATPVPMAKRAQPPMALPRATHKYAFNLHLSFA